MYFHLHWQLLTTVAVCTCEIYLAVRHQRELLVVHNGR